MLEHKKHGRHDKLMLVLNTDGFYDGLKIQLERMEKDGLLTKPVNEPIHFAKTLEEAIDLINSRLKSK